MQILKDDIKERIINVARKQFKQKGFIKASMRDIAKEVNIGVGNIYNYFHNKDELFHCVVKPVTNILEKMLLKHHGENGLEVLYKNKEENIQNMSNELFSFINGNKELLDILFFKAQGSSLENFSETFTDQATLIIKAWFIENKKRHPEINTNFSDFLIHIHTVWQFSLLRELVMHDIGEEEMKKVIQEYIVFETKGWKELIGI
ncbi:MAG: TetR/AcrR family transcriptional regulator [Massilibacteroides sp.]|nr:TetR/AcrR family transcriptional regulator [Massilibacteroides sp.]MDD4114124.1 TetR/AcrR family transcriptional regulator [Massilibacteroides sp.]